MHNQPQGLIDVLLNPQAEYGDRHDAAMDLGAFDGMDVEEALSLVASDATANEGLADACGESLGQIWSRTGSVNEKLLIELTSVSLDTALATLKQLSPNLEIHAKSVIKSQAPR